MKKLLITLFAIATCLTAFGQMKTGLIYGPNHFYSLTAPDGWILDNVSGKRLGIQATFYPIKENWDNAEVKAYTYFVTVPNDITLDRYIQDDIDAFKKEHNAKATFVKDIKANDGNSFKVYYYTYPQADDTKHEYVAFVRCKTGVINITCTSYNKKALKEADDKFDSLVKSYLWMGDNVKIEDENDSDGDNDND